MGFVTGAGDVLTGGISLCFFIQAAMFKIKASVLNRRFINILLDVLIGAIPMLGEAFDVIGKQICKMPGY